MRGKVRNHRRIQLHDGITPAYAGKSTQCSGTYGHGGDHPRLCGEKDTPTAESMSTRGSPPPMRGKATAPAGTEIPTRITPAYAGKSTPFWQKKQGCQGSPPPMRGKGVVRRCQHQSCGITPAYAGKSVEVIRYAEILRDHPRLCGEKHRSNVFTSISRGSPPPMRGKVFIGFSPSSFSRITPAYAGKSKLLF